MDTHRPSYGKPRQDANPAGLIHTSKPFYRRRRAASALLVARAACCLPALASAQTAKEISVVTPSASKQAGQEFTINWFYFTAGDTTTGDLNSFDLDLRSCGFDGSGCQGSAACGNEFASLCIRDDGICMDSDGSFDVQIPDTAEAGMYSIKVSLADDPTVSSCTDAFEVTAAADSTVVVEEGKPSIEVVAPQYLEVGEPFTAQWVYDDGAGGTEGTFQISLHTCAGGDCEDTGCGDLSVTLCEDPGCFDPGTGDYDVVVPADQPLGEYKLQVKNSDDLTSHCTYLTFYVIKPGGDIPTLTPSSTPLETPSPVEPRTASPNTPTDAPVSPTDSPSAPTTAPSAPTTSPNAPTGAPNVPTGGPTASTDNPTSPSVAPTPPDDPSLGEPGTPGNPPTPVPAKVVCDDTAELEFVYTRESTKLPLITVTHASGDRAEAGCLTLTKLYDWLATAPTFVPEGLLYTVTPSTGVADTSMTATPTGTWLLSTSVEVTNGVTFAIKGTSLPGGDCDELKLSSTVKKWNRIVGYGGNIDINSTLIRSWDASKMLEHIFKASTDGKAARSFISCVSEVADPDETCVGVAQNDMGECRMDIVDSELGYLGYDTTESYGITWKVRGLCSDLSNLDLFDKVRVYGDMTGSNIHHMWYGMYSYGHLGGVWTDNEMHDNHVYGFDPHDDSDYLTIANNVVYNNGNHGIIASKRCDHLLVKDNVSYDNDGSGIMLHKSCDDSIVSGNECTDNFDAGLSIVETSRCSVTGNTFGTNRWGFRVILGSTDNVFDGNTLTENRYSDIYVYYGAQEEVPEVDPFTGINVNNVFSNNVVNYDVNSVVDVEDADGTELSSNTFNGEGGYFVFLRSTETHVVDNTGEATTGLSDEIQTSCFTPQSDRLPLC